MMQLIALPTMLACGLRFGFLPTNTHLLLHTGIGVAFGLLSGYAARRLVPPPPNE